jgi:hypothetical protein
VAEWDVHAEVGGVAHVVRKVADVDLFRVSTVSIVAIADDAQCRRDGSQDGPAPPSLPFPSLLPISVIQRARDQTRAQRVVDALRR